MNRRTLLKSLSVSAMAMALPGIAGNRILRNMNSGMLGKFEPDWDSLSKYQVPKWFRDAKFGIWAHWGPQCEPERGDWYGRHMYMEGHPQSDFHREKYGHPSEVGFKDVIHNWKADEWDPDGLVELYKNAGAKYFMAMANHHDNLDLFDSKYHPEWNSLKTGPKKNIIAGWKKAADKNGLPFGVSVHAAHAWLWYETSQRWDLNGPYKGIPYDGNLKENSGQGEWFERMNVQDLYVQDHKLSENSWDNSVLFNQWDWDHGAAQPSAAFIKNVYQRTIDLVEKYSPEMVYFDDTVLPFWPINKDGLKFLADYYNSNLMNGEPNVVVTGKKLNDIQKESMIWDIERGQSNQIEKEPWQTCTCIGNWHYDRRIYENNSYKTPKKVIHMLCDIVSKNGNLMLNIPVRGNGSIDEIERSIVKQIGSWMNDNGESIYETRPWEIFGEGPAIEGAAKIEDQGFNEGKNKSFTSKDIRFTIKGDKLYVIAMGIPENGKIRIKSLSKRSAYHHKPIENVKLVSTKQSLKFSRNKEYLEIKLPDNLKTKYAISFQIT